MYARLLLMQPKRGMPTWSWLAHMAAVASGVC